MAADATKGHGRRERRTLTTATALVPYLSDWPGLRQVFHLRRERTARNKTTGRRETAVEDVYGICSVPRERGGAAALLGWQRGHWAIENGLHHVADVTLGEDACRVRKGAGAGVLATFRRWLAPLLGDQDAPSIAAALRANVLNLRGTLARLFPETAEN